MLKQAVGQTAIALPLSESDSLHSLSLSAASTHRSRPTFNLDAFTKSKQFNPDSLNTNLAIANSTNANLLNTDSLSIIDAPNTEQCSIPGMV